MKVPGDSLSRGLLCDSKTSRNLREASFEPLVYFPVSPNVECRVPVSAIPQQTHLHLNVGVLCSFARLG